MKYNVLAVALLFATPAMADDCQKTITVELSQSHFTLDLWQHAKDAMNAVTFKLPVACSFYDKVKVGDELLDKNFRVGSLLVHGSIGDWHLQIVSKEQ